MSASIYGTSQISSYEEELAAAKKAASLAARLCQVLSNTSLIAFNWKGFSEILTYQLSVTKQCTCVYFFLPPTKQLVQAEILQSDVQSKADKSPVTVADYGIFIIQHI